ncbi:unnamed protein product, partial [marine sediment metagenome]
GEVVHHKITIKILDFLWHEGRSSKLTKKEFVETIYKLVGV